MKNRPESHRRWRCPKCKSEFRNPIPCTMVVCPAQYHGNRKDPVAMQPVAGEEE